ncbi:hypothetical protein [Phenylobacterium sp.]|jgi:uncharacterized membrane protein|uniref:DUF2306 domain-containing protein n=1 Tax=Phenylobacterium sp. TaxID=1871053 RepID=UPI002ED9A3A3
MSTASQTPRPRNAAWWAASGVATLAVLALAMTPFRDAVLRLAAQGSLHTPDFSLIAGLSPVIKIHLFTALAALVLGGVLMIVRKGRTFHRVAGWTWVGLVSVTAGATLFITQLNHGSWSFLHLFTGWTLLVLPLAVFAAKRHDVRRHRRTMMGLFYGGFAINLFVAFIPGRTLWMTFFG